MSQAAWTKEAARVDDVSAPSLKADRLKFLLAGAVVVAAVIYLIVAGTNSGAQYFMTVDELVGNTEYVGKSVRISGAVMGDTIQYDGNNLILDFTIAHIPTNTEDLAYTLYLAANDPNASQLRVHVEGQVKPDLLQHEAQAILTGTVGEDGVFYASEVLMKCPSRYEESVPEQVQTE